MTDEKPRAYTRTAELVEQAVVIAIESARAGKPVLVVTKEEEPGMIPCARRPFFLVAHRDVTIGELLAVDMREEAHD